MGRKKAVKPDPIKRIDKQYLTSDYSEEELGALGFTIPLNRNMTLRDFALAMNKPFNSVKFWMGHSYFDTVLDVMSKVIYVHPDAQAQFKERKKSA